MFDHLLDTIQDPYVRKTAAICVAKLYDINPDLVEVQGFLDMLQELISDSNPTVVANAVAALSEIQASSGEVRSTPVCCRIIRIRKCASMCMRLC